MQSLQHNDNALPEAPGIGELSALLKAGADSLRLQILQVLCRNAFSVMELCQILDHKQSGMSHHLKILAQAGLVTTRREGNTIFYSRSHPADQGGFSALHESLLQATDTVIPDMLIASRLAAVQDKRAQSSLAFFKDNADKFHAQQELIVDYESYAEEARQLLDQAGPRERRLALEIGPGEGAFLVDLGQRFERVIGVDNAQPMLDKARAAINAQSLVNVELLLGDSTHSALPQERADCVVLNMVLHHVPSPEAVLADAVRLLRSGGVLLISELCRHDQDWARSACGDLWLGFTPEELQQSLQRLGLHESRSVYVAQRNGFRLQVHLFSKPERPNTKAARTPLERINHV